jgi:hypothetical protein
VKHFDWNDDKNKKLREERGVGFEDTLIAISEGGILDVVENDKDAYLVTFVESEETIFLKTIIPSRKATKKYLFGK